MSYHHTRAWCLPGFVYVSSFLSLFPGGVTQYIAPLMAGFKWSQTHVYCDIKGIIVLLQQLC